MLPINIAQKYGIVLSKNLPRKQCVGSERRSPVGKFSDDCSNDSVYSGRIFPSGDFSVGIVPKKKIAPRDKEYESNKGRIEERQVKWQEGKETYVEKYVVGYGTSPPSPNLVNPLKFSQPKRKPYGGKGITTYGKRMVSSAAVILERDWGKACTGFGTLTLPPMSTQIESHICADWGNIVRCFFQELCRHQRRHGNDDRYVHVTEIQEERWRKRGELGLHIHFLYKARKHAYSKDWFIDADWCRDTWRRILANSLGMSALEIPKPRIELSTIKKSAAGYIGKYMSKGAKLLNEVKEACGEELRLPATWWGMCNTLRDTVKQGIILLSSPVCAMLWSIVSIGDSGLFAYTKQVEIVSDVFGLRTVGCFGRIFTHLISFLIELLT